jgi:hypothetical protein
MIGWSWINGASCLHLHPDGNGQVTSYALRSLFDKRLSWFLVVDWASCWGTVSASGMPFSRQLPAGVCGMAESDIGHWTLDTGTTWEWPAFHAPSNGEQVLRKFE